MTEKILIPSEKEFLKMKRTSWKDDQYVTYIIETPKSYPCVALVTNYWDAKRKSSTLGTIYEINEFVYPEDFDPLKNECP